MKQSSSSNPMKILTIDVETTMDAPNELSASSPYHEGNRLVAIGAKVYGIDKVNTQYLKPGETLEFVGPKEVQPVMHVGHNYGFDLEWQRRYYKEPEEFYEHLDTVKVWDTQIAEYVLTGQRDKFIKLDELAERRLGRGKIDLPFEPGKGADHFKEDLLVEYLERDIRLTEEIALQQMEEANDEQFNLILQMGEMLKVVCEMEHNGMHIDSEGMIDNMAALLTERRVAMDAMNEWLDQAALIKDKPEWYKSNHVMSAILFGGHVNYKQKVSIGVYKTGKKRGLPKYKMEDMSLKFEGYFDPAAVGSKATKKKNKQRDTIYTVDEDVLKNITSNCLMDKGVLDMLGALERMRKVDKVINTYYTNLVPMSINGIVHHKLNQTATATGRLSSSKPNLQNVPMADKEEPYLNVKAKFTSRFGLDGRILEIDFKQLEVCALAWLTKDPQLITDINAGRDIHTEIGKQLGLDTTDKKIRRDVKAVVFAMIYGAGAKGISASTGLDVEFVKSVMNGFYSRYSTVQDFYERLRDEVGEHGKRYDLIHRSETGEPLPMYEWTSPTGRKYIFKEDPYRRDVPAHTQLRNYPVQGTATGDVVPVVLAEVFDVLRNEKSLRSRALLTSTTHDSVTMDCKDDETVTEVCEFLHWKVFGDIVNIINKRIPTIKWDIPLTVEYESGPDWGSLEPIDTSYF